MAKNYFLIAIVTVSVWSASFVWSNDRFLRQSSVDELTPLMTVINLIEQVYVNSVDRSDVMEETLHHLLRSLDSYSEYLSQAQYSQLVDDTEGQFAGIGVDLMRQEDALLVVAPYVGSPASKIRNASA